MFFLFVPPPLEKIFLILKDTPKKVNMIKQ